MLKPYYNYGALGDLPSEAAVKNLLLEVNQGGHPEAYGQVAGSVALRAGIISIGLWLAGIRGKKLVVGSIASAALIEAGVIGYTAKRAMDDNLIVFMRS